MEAASHGLQANRCRATGASRPAGRVRSPPADDTDDCVSGHRDSRQYTETSRLLCREEHRRFFSTCLSSRSMRFSLRRRSFSRSKSASCEGTLVSSENTPTHLPRGRMPPPLGPLLRNALPGNESQIRRNLTPCRAAGLRDANRIPLELVAVYRCHIRRTHGPTLDGEYCSEKTGTKPGQVQIGWVPRGYARVVA